jgi:Na+-driven multidrug efflux pump
MTAPFYSAIAMEFTIRAEGNPKLPAKIIASAAVLNMILDPIMISVFHMGVEGTAIATVISEGLSAVFFFKYYLSGKSRLKIKLKNIRFSKEIFIPILSLGFAPFIMDIASSSQNMLTNGLLLRYSGENGVAVMGIVFAVSTIFMMTAFGIGDGMIPIVSFNLGAGNPDRMKQILRIAAISIEVLSLTLLLIIELIPAQIAGFFVGNSPEITAAAVTALRIFAISIPLYSFQIIGSRYLQAAHKPGKASLSVFLRQLIIFIPAVLALSALLGTNGIWIAFPITDLIAAAITWLLIHNQNQCMLEEDGNIMLEKKRA